MSEAEGWNAVADVVMSVASQTRGRLYVLPVPDRKRVRSSFASLQFRFALQVGVLSKALASRLGGKDLSSALVSQCRLSRGSALRLGSLVLASPRTDCCALRRYGRLTEVKCEISIE